MNDNNLTFRPRQRYVTYTHWSFDLTERAPRAIRRALFKNIWNKGAA